MLNAKFLAVTACAALAFAFVAQTTPARAELKPLEVVAGLKDAQVKKRDEITAKAWDYLKTQYNYKGTQEKRMLDAGWGPESPVLPYTALVLQSLLGTKHFDAKDKMITDSVAFILENQDTTGAFHILPLKMLLGDQGQAMKGARAIYTTSIVLQLMVDLNAMDPWKGKLTQQIEKARDYVKQSQVGNPEGPAGDYKRDSVGFGGWAYSKEEIEKSVRKDGKPPANMSTTIYAIDALKACGVSPEDKIWADALVFLKRSQNADEVQDDKLPLVAKDKKFEGKKITLAGPDSPDYGGSMYSEDTSMVDGATENKDGSITLYSYGAMTYNLLRGYLYAGLKKDSLPVKLALGWVRRNYTLAKVPGYRDPKQFEQGLFYYFVTFARTFKALGEDTFEDDRGFKHDWRSDLITRLAEMQKADGSWINDKNPRWQEDAPVMATAFALDALRHTR